MRAFSTWTAVLALALGLGQPATAQNQFAPAITVNERVITQYELTQRHPPARGVWDPWRYRTGRA